MEAGLIQTSTLFRLTLFSLEMAGSIRTMANIYILGQKIFNPIPTRQG